MLRWCRFAVGDFFVIENDPLPIPFHVGHVVSTAGMFTNMRYRPNNTVLAVAIFQGKLWGRSRRCSVRCTAIKSGDGAIQIILSLE